MATIELNLSHHHHYEVRIEYGAIASLGHWVRHVAPHPRAVVLADAAVYDTHAQTVASSLSEAGYKPITHRLVSGEDQKNLTTVRQLYDVLLAAHIERASPIVAVGGGVTGDTAGFVAATYLRGVPLVQCPTTLLAMVDASVGGKVGVNLPQGKNLIGSFYQPSLVVVDTATLATLPADQLRCGLAECVKHAVIRDADLFAWIDQNLDAIMSLDQHAMIELVRRNVQIKADVVMQDEKEAGQRAHLNFGHTFGHAIEATIGYARPGGIQHGQAVSLGMVAATRLAADTGRCDPAVVQRLTALLNRIGLPTRTGKLPATPVLLNAMRLDKKVSQGRLRLVLPNRLGSVSVVEDVPEQVVAQAWTAIGDVQ